MRFLLATAVVILALAGSAAAAAPPLVPNSYAFPASWVKLKQKQIQVWWPGAGCLGRNPVPLAGGGTGYRFIQCLDELDNPPTLIWFRINSSGRVIMDVTLGHI